MKTNEMVAHARAAARNKVLPVGEAWKLIDQLADELEGEHHALMEMLRGYRRLEELHAQTFDLLVEHLGLGFDCYWVAPTPEWFIADLAAAWHRRDDEDTETVQQALLDEGWVVAKDA